MSIKHPVLDSTVQALRDSGHVVVVWTPEEAEAADAEMLEDIATDKGNSYIQWCKDRDAIAAQLEADG